MQAWVFAEMLQRIPSDMRHISNNSAKSGQVHGMSPCHAKGYSLIRLFACHACYTTINTTSAHQITGSAHPELATAASAFMLNQLHGLQLSCTLDGQRPRYLLSSIRNLVLRSPVNGT